MEYKKRSAQGCKFIYILETKKRTVGAERFGQNLELGRSGI